MGQRALPPLLARLLLAVLVPAACLASVNAGAASAFSLDEYFTYSYNMQLSQTEVRAGEVFSATISGQAVCKKDLPLTPSSAYVKSRIVARHQATGAMVTLNPTYTMTLSSVPSKQGDSAQETAVVPLVFPGGSQTGTYTIIGETIEAKVRVLVIWVDVTGILPSSQELGTVTCRASGSSGGLPGSAGSSVPGRVGSGLSDCISSSGRFLQTVTLESTDGGARATVRQGTTALTSEGQPLTSMSVAQMDEPPPSPANAVMASPVYDFGPDGATFDRPVRILLAYDEARIPQGVREERLLMAIWDRGLREWRFLISTVDTAANTVVTEVTHFTPYAVVARTRPASFVISDLAIAPDRARPGQTITIKVLVSNTGDLPGRHLVTLKIDDTATAIQDLPLDGGTSRAVVFTALEDAPGTYSVVVGELSGSFTIESSSPPEQSASFTTTDLRVSPETVDAGQDVTISVLVTNTGDLAGTHRVQLRINGAVTADQEVTLEAGASRRAVFITSRHTAGTYEVSIGGMTRTFVVEETVPPPPQEEVEPALPVAGTPVNWGLIGGAGAGAVALLTALTLLVLKRRRT